MKVGYNMFDWSTERLQDQLDSLADTTQLIFVHPNCHQQNRVMHFLIKQDNASYLSFKGKDLTTVDLQTQTESHLKELSPNTINMIILDECDRAIQAEFNTFIKQFANAHKETRIAIVSRLVAHDLLEDEQFRKRSQFIPVNEALMLYDYAQRDSANTLVEVRAFGSGYVHINGRAIENWDGILPRRLFFYFADRGMVTRKEIFETFWDDLPKQEATNVFHVTKRKVTDVIGESFTKFSSGFYRISPNIEFSYDVIRFTELIQQSIVQEDHNTIELLENAVELYRAPFLNSENDYNTPWVEKRQSELNEMFGEALFILAGHKLHIGDTDQALGHYLNALKILNHREEIVEKVMEIYWERSLHQDALDLYEWIKDNLDSDYGIQPNKRLKELASKIKRELDDKE
jgi:DNA-binding SARP family transcriptional activator